MDEAFDKILGFLNKVLKFVEDFMLAIYNAVDIITDAVD